VDRLRLRNAEAVGASGLGKSWGEAWPLGRSLGPESSSLASGVMMMPGLIVLTRASRLPQRTASAMTRSELPRFASWYACSESGTWSG
jgi:hypothetical protein